MARRRHSANFKREAVRFAQQFPSTGKGLPLTHPLIGGSVKNSFSPGRIMRRRCFAVWTCSIGLLALCASMASGQSYPNKPIRIVTSEPGGGNDVLARLIGPLLTTSLGQQVIIDNRGGAGGVIAAQIVAKAPADGYTLLFYGSALWLLPFLTSNVPWDPVKDFSPITLAGSSPNLLVVHPSLPVKSVNELIALAKAKPGELNYGSGGTGTTPHLAGALFRAMAGIDVVRVAYKAGGMAINGLIGGEVQFMFPTVSLGIPHVQSGRLKALAVTSAQPSALTPGLPTVAASGLPDYESVLMVGVYGPARTPATLVNRLNQEIIRVLNRADVKERFLAAGLEVVVSTPEQLAASVRTDMAKWGKVIKEAGIRAE